MLKKASLFGLILLAVTLTIGGVYALTRPNERLEVQAQLSVSDALAINDTSGFARVTEPREFVFPEDHGPHPEYGIEWWYYTGNLDSPQGSHFGYELTFFRIGLSSEQQDRQSDWAASQLFMGHFALTDVASNRFHSFERFSRDAIGLAGAQASPFHVWLEDWSVQRISSDENPVRPEPVEGCAINSPDIPQICRGLEVLPIRLQASQDGIAIDLALTSDKPIVLQGDRGYSRKSAEEGNASYYYSLTRMPTSGTVRVGGQEFSVSGASWMDREWSTTALSENQVGWDWFALQLSDGRDIMYYQLRLKDGGIDPFSSGTVVSADGATSPLKPDDVQIEVLDTWNSPSGGQYPSKWRIRIPSQNLDVTITPYISNQELDVSVRYWEGAVRIEGTSQGQPITGNGYVEMTGYAEESGGRS